MEQQLAPRILVLALALLPLTACGGGSGGTIASAPIPIATPTPSPSPSPTPSSSAVLPPAAVALKSDQPFTTLGVTETDSLSSARDASLSGSKDVDHIIASIPGGKGTQVDFRYNAATNTYSMAFPDGTGGDLVLKGLNGSAGQPATSTGHSVMGANGDIGVWVSMPAPTSSDYPFTYSHWGDWEKTVVVPDGSAVKTYGLYVYGSETPSAAIPRVGTAHYAGQIVANSPLDPWQIGGVVEMTFDFAGGSLGGYIHPVFDTNGWYPDFDYDYGRYDFVQTAFTAGGSRYSGSFSRNGAALPASWFEGLLTGPTAQETIGRFEVHFDRAGTNGTITGIWIGKRN